MLYFWKGYGTRTSKKCSWVSDVQIHKCTNTQIYKYTNTQELSQDPGKKDYKTRLQEHYAKIGKKVTYENTSTGPDHSKEFSSKVLLSDNVIGTGKGKSKKNAEQIAAKVALLNAKN